MLDLTFGEQVKIVLSRKGMTIKELAEIIESKTGKKMSRQNLTQRLGRDNFQEQDMRMIAEILECPFQLNILNEDDSIESNYNNKEEAMVLKKRQKLADKKQAKENDAPAKKAEEAAPVESQPEVEEAKAEAVSVEPAVVEAEKEPEVEAVAEAEPEVAVEAIPESEMAEVEEAGEAVPEVAEVVEEPVAPACEEELAEEPVAAAYEPETPVEEAQTYVEEAVDYTENLAQNEEAVDYTENLAQAEETVEAVQAAPVEEHEESQPEEKKEEKPKRGWFANFRRRGKEEKAAKETKAEEEKPEPVKEAEETYCAPANDEAWQEESADQFQDNGSYLNSLVQEASAQNDWYPQVEEAYREEVEAVETVPVEEEDLERGEINPYTGREYQTNSVRVHPKKIGYVQVYNRGIHAWEEMTEWAFLGYQEQKKAELGKAYEEPIYLD